MENLAGNASQARPERVEVNSYGMIGGNVLMLDAQGERKWREELTEIKH